LYVATIKVRHNKLIRSNRDQIQVKGMFEDTRVLIL